MASTRDEAWSLLKETQGLGVSIQLGERTRLQLPVDLGGADQRPEEGR